MKLRVRIDGEDDLQLTNFIQLWKPASYVIMKHWLPHGNPHYHIYVDDNATDKAYRERIKRKLQLQSSDFSVKKCDDDRINEYVQYMFNTKHGNQWKLIDTHNFDNELLTTLEKSAKEVSNNYELTHKSKKDKGPTIWDIAVEIESIVSPALSVNDLGNQELWSQREMMKNEEERITIYTETAIKVLRKHKKAFDEFLLRKVISTAMSSTTEGKNNLIRKMKNNFIDYKNFY